MKQQMMEKALFICTIYVLIFAILDSSIKTSAQDTNATDVNTTQETTTEISRSARMRQRSRDDRLSFIRQQVLQVLGWQDVPVIENKQALLSQMRNDIESRQMTTQRCYAATCDLPRWITPALWFAPNSRALRLIFDIIRPSSGNVVVTGATLKLYLKHQACCCSSTCTDERPIIKVEVHQFKKPLRTGRIVRRVLMDDITTRWRPGTWISFNVADAAHDWITRGKRNHGFEIKVFDALGNTIDASNVFDAVDCRLHPDIDCNTYEVNFSTPNSVLEIVATEIPEVFGEDNVSDRQKRDADRRVILTNTKQRQSHISTQHGSHQRNIKHQNKHRPVNEECMNCS